MVMVLPSEAALEALKQEVFEVEGSDVIPEDGPLPPGSPPRASFMTQSKVRTSLRPSASSLGSGACSLTQIAISRGHVRLLLLPRK